MVLTRTICTILCSAVITIYPQVNRRSNNIRLIRADTVQQDSSSNQKTTFTIGTDYASRVLFCGRDFGERQHGLSPYLMVNFKSGFTLYTVADFWSATPRKPARNVFGLSYENQLTKKLSVFAGYERWLNHYDDDYFDRAMQNEIEAGLSYTLGKYSLEPTFYYFFGLEHIYELDITLARETKLYSITENLKLWARADFATIMATPVFSYIFDEFPDPNYDYEKFRLVDFEGSVSLNVILGNLELAGKAHYNRPVNVGNESLTSFPYFTVELNYSF